MSEPFVYIGAYRVKPGKLEEARHRLCELTELVEKREPQLGAFHFYLDEVRGRAICVQVHPEPDSMATHMAVIAEHLDTAWDWLEQDSAKAMWLGTPPDVLVNYAREFDETFDAYPTHIAGFTRPAPVESRP
jgi:hypothetical protein